MFKYQFSITRDVQGVPTEIQLEAEFDIHPYVSGKTQGEPDTCYPPKSGYAMMLVTLFVTHSTEGIIARKVDNPWIWYNIQYDEVDRIEANAYKAWEDLSKDDCESDDLDDSFHDERAIHLSGNGKAQY